MYLIKTLISFYLSTYFWYSYYTFMMANSLVLQHLIIKPDTSTCVNQNKLAIAIYQLRLPSTHPFLKNVRLGMAIEQYKNNDKAEIYSSMFFKIKERRIIYTSR